MFNNFSKFWSFRGYSFCSSKE